MKNKNKLTRFFATLRMTRGVDISLDCYKNVTNQAANNIFQIRLETCLARHLRASLFDFPSANFF